MSYFNNSRTGKKTESAFTGFYDASLDNTEMVNQIEYDTDMYYTGMDDYDDYGLQY